MTVFLLAAGLFACGSKKKLGAPIPECNEYVEKTRACFGARAATRAESMFAKAPVDIAELEARQRLCAERTETIRRVCH